MRRIRRAAAVAKNENLSVLLQRFLQFVNDLFHCLCRDGFRGSLLLVEIITDPFLHHGSVVVLQMDPAQS